MSDSDTRRAINALIRGAVVLSDTELEQVMDHLDKIRRDRNQSKLVARRDELFRAEPFWAEKDTGWVVHLVLQVESYESLWGIMVRTGCGSVARWGIDYTYEERERNLKGTERSLCRKCVNRARSRSFVVPGEDPQPELAPQEDVMAEQIRVGDRCRYRGRGDQVALALGDLVVEVVREHPSIGRMVEIRTKDGWTTWVSRETLYRLKGE